MTSRAGEPNGRRDRSARVAREVIIQAAATVFARHGYHRTTIEDIARASGYSSAAIYKYFDGKEDLLIGLWISMTDELALIFEEANALGLPFPTCLQVAVGRIGRMLEKTPEFLISYIAQRPQVGQGEPSELAQRALQHYHRYLDQVTALMARGIEERHLRDVPPGDLALLLCGLLYMYTCQWATLDVKNDPSHGAGRIIDLFLYGAGNVDGSDVLAGAVGKRHGSTP
jgi:AcrR family transcriptional regulator